MFVDKRIDLVQYWCSPKIGQLFEHHSLHHGMTIRGCIALGMELRPAHKLYLRVLLLPPWAVGGSWAWRLSEISWVEGQLTPSVQGFVLHPTDRQELGH